MRTNFLQILVGLTTVTVLVACGDDGGGTGGGGGGDTSTSADATGTTVAGPGTSTVTSTTGGSPVAQSTGTGGTCTASLFEDVDLNSCAQASCCDEMTVCDPALGGDPALCFNEDGQLDETLPGGGPLADCILESECFGSFAEWCTSGIGFQDPDEEAQELADCITDNCCDPLDACITNSADECIACLNGEILDANGDPDFSLCEAVSNCSRDNCEQGLIFVPVCESGLGLSSVEIGTCLNDNCCDEYTDCTGGDPNDTDAIQACIDCFNSENPTELCAPAIACEEEFCNTAICDSGLTIENIELATCLTDSCCVEYNTCTGTGSDADIQACLDCFNAYDPDSGTPAGDLCAPAIACEDLNCAGGGEGGGGQGGGGGAGGAGGGI